MEGGQGNPRGGKKSQEQYEDACVRGDHGDWTAFTGTGPWREMILLLLLSAPSDHQELFTKGWEFPVPRYSVNWCYHMLM